MSARSNVELKASAARLTGLALQLSDDELERFEGVVRFHEAARDERLLMQSADPITAHELVRGWAEVCAAYIDGLDPPSANDAWAHVVREGQPLPEVEFRSMTQRLSKRLRAINQRFIEEARHVAPHLTSRTLTIPAASGRDDLLEHFRRICAAFPGVAVLWYARYRLEFQSGLIAEATRSIGRAALLDPRPNYLALQVDAWSRERMDDFESKVLAAARAAGSGSDVVHLFAGFAYQRAGQMDQAREHVERGLDVAASSPVRRLLRALSIELAAQAVGETRRLHDVLYRADLGRHAAYVAEDAEGGLQAVARRVLDEAA